MPRRTFGQEAFRMDHLRTSPSQQHLDPTSRSSTSSQQDPDDLEADMSGPAGMRAETSGAELGPAVGGGRRAHKLDLYSIPVFLLECLAIAGLAYAAYFIHFQYKLKPLLSGFYCDDISLRQSFSENAYTKLFRRPDNELMMLGGLLVVPLMVVFFCELVNSMFGSLKFRQINSLCECCTLHSITRRTLRFSGAYLLGFLIVVISCDVLATSAGKFHPYFAQECPLIYENECLRPQMQLGAAEPGSSAQPLSSGSRELERLIEQQAAAAAASTSSPSSPGPLPGNASGPTGDERSNNQSLDSIRPLSQPIASSGQGQLVDAPKLANGRQIGENNSFAMSRTRRDTSTQNQQQQQQINRSIIERKWIDLTNANLKELCQFRGGDDNQTRLFNSLAMSWPSFPGAIISYACFYLACYLSFVGTARPFRMITSILVVCLLLCATILNVQLVKLHYNHWEDVAGAAALSLVVVVFILLVYLNKFRDTHYYENQKLYGSASKRQQQLRRSLMMTSDVRPYNVAYSNEAGQYHLDKIDSSHHLGGGATAPIVQNGAETLSAGATTSNNDLAMRYFQIPRANYRGAPRPLSTVNRP